MTSPIVRRVAAVGTTGTFAGDLLLGHLSWQVGVVLAVAVPAAFVVWLILDYRFGRAAIDKTEPAGVPTVIAALHGHPVPGSAPTFARAADSAGVDKIGGPDTS